MYESNWIFGKSEYSYLQYHWCPIALIVTEGELISSVKYRSRNDGIAKNSNVIAGKIVQIVSICCASTVTRDVNLLVINIINEYVTTDTTSVKITSAWSWKDVIWSIIGDAASWNINWPQCVMLVCGCCFGVINILYLHQFIF